MTPRSTLMLGMAVVAGCGNYDAAPPSFSEASQPEVLFLVRTEVMSIRLDGTVRRSLGNVGDDRHRTGFPRFLPDGRVAVLADDTGGIFPFVGSPLGGDFKRLPNMNVTLNDALCGVTVGGQSRLVFTTSPFTPFWPMATRLYRMDVDNPQLEAVGFQSSGPNDQAGAITEPAPYDDGRVVAVRTLRPDGLTPGVSSVELLRVDRAFDHDQAQTSEKLATLADGLLAHAPARLPDGRVVFIRVNPDGVSDTDVGEMLVIGLDNQVSSTGLVGVLALEVVGDQIVYETGGADGVSDLVMSDLTHAPVNITNTPFVSEHIGWSD